MKYRKRPIVTTAVADRDGTQLAPQQPSMRLQFIAERQFIQRHIQALNWLNSKPPFSSPISDWRAQA